MKKPKKVPDWFRHIRKPTPPPSHVHGGKKGDHGYDRNREKAQLRREGASSRGRLNIFPSLFEAITLCGELKEVKRRNKMPLIVVYNAQEKIDANHVGLRNTLRKACVSVKELGLKGRDDITIVFSGVQPEFCSEGGPLIIVVEILFDKLERTLGVRRKLAKALFEAARNFYYIHKLPLRPVEVAVKRFNPEKDAFWTDGD